VLVIRAKQTARRSGREHAPRGSSLLRDGHYAHAADSATWHCGRRKRGRTHGSSRARAASCFVGIVLVPIVHDGAALVSIDWGQSRASDHPHAEEAGNEIATGLGFLRIFPCAPSPRAYSPVISVLIGRTLGLHSEAAWRRPGAACFLVLVLARSDIVVARSPRLGRCFRLDRADQCRGSCASASCQPRSSSMFTRYRVVIVLVPVLAALRVISSGLAGTAARSAYRKCRLPRSAAPGFTGGGRIVLPQVMPHLSGRGSWCSRSHAAPSRTPAIIGDDAESRLDVWPMTKPTTR